MVRYSFSSPGILILTSLNNMPRTSFGCSALGRISDHLSHPFHPNQPKPLQVKHHRVDVLEFVVAVEVSALLGRLEIAIEARFLLLFKAPFDQEAPGAPSPVFLCCNKEREY